MLRYSKYLLTNIISKKAIWILLFLSIAVTFGLSFVQITVYNDKYMSYTTAINTFAKMVPFIFGIAFMTLIVVYVFKEGEDDGTELMIVSKPISRAQIITGKFLIVLLSLILFAMLEFLSQYIYIQLDIMSDQTQKVKFAASVGVGELIVLTIATFILMLIASFVSKVGTITLGIVSAAIIPIGSTIVATVSHGVPTQIGRTSIYSANQKMVDKTIEKDIDEYINENKKPNLTEFLDTDLKRTIPVNDHYLATDYKKYKDQVWYDKVAYIDPWYQWNSFYDLFTGTSSANLSETYKINVNYETTHVSDEYRLESVKGTNVTVPVDIFSGSAVDMEYIGKMLLNTFGIIKYKDDDTTPILKNAVLPDAIKNFKFVQIYTAEDIGTSYEVQIGIKTKDQQHTVKLIDLFTKDVVPFYDTKGVAIMDSFNQPVTFKPTFEDRVRGIAESNNARGRTDDRVKYFSMTEFIMYKAITAITKQNDPLTTKYIQLMKKELDTETIKAKEELAKAITQTDKTMAQKRVDEMTLAKTAINTFVTQKTTIFGNKPLTEILGYSNPMNVDNYIIAKKISNAHEQTAIKKSWKKWSIQGVMIDGKKQWMLSVDRFISRSNIVLIWSIIGFLLIGLTIFRYYRKDFK